MFEAVAQVVEGLVVAGSTSKKEVASGVTCAHTDCVTPVLVEGAFYCSAHTNTKEESTMTKVTNTVKDKAVVLKDQAKEALTKTKESSVWSTIANPFKVAYTWVKDKVVSPTLSFLDGKKTAIAIGSAAVTAGGLVTTGTVAAVAVGAGIASLVVLAAHAMQKKKEKGLQWKAMFTDMGVAVGTAALLPFLLLGAAYAGLFVTAFGFILPYSIIVA